jgi:hypothetical protein
MKTGRKMEINKDARESPSTDPRERWNKETKG